MSARFTEVKTAMLLHMPFFASLLLDMMDVKIGKFPELFGSMKPTAATNGKSIFFDEDWLNTLTVQEAVGVTCHEIGHAMWHHMSRAKYYVDLGFEGQKFHPIVWNIAGDYVINDMLKKCGVVLPKEGCFSTKYTSDWLVDDVYRELMKDAKHQQMDGDGKGDGNQPGFDKHIYETEQVSKAEMRRAIQSAYDTAKAIGNVPGELKRFADQLLEATVDWREKLRHLVITRAQRDTSTWTRPHRRRLTAQRMYMPRAAGFGCGTIVVAIDTSGSVGDKELKAFLSELADILRTCKPEIVWVLGADAAVATAVELPGDTDISGNPPEVGGGGGTDFRPVFEWVNDKGISPDALVYLTDMMGPFPKDAPGYPVIWGATTDTKGPFGETVAVKA